MKVTQKDRERCPLLEFLRRIGEKPKQWKIHAEQERPDFILSSPAGDMLTTGIHRTLICLAAFALACLSAGCSKPRPDWVCIVTDTERDAEPTRHYDVQHLFAQRYPIPDLSFDLSEALSCTSSGPSTDLDWAYNDVWEDQGQEIRRILEHKLALQELRAGKINYTFQSFTVTATPEVHQAIEQIFLQLSTARYDTIKKE